jgi:deoxyribonuclease IV
MIKFGPSGNSQLFYDEGNKASVQMPKWIKEFGLDAYEYQCGKGVRISEQTASNIGNNAKLMDVFLSIHAPYYINLANIDAEKRANSKRYIFDTLNAAKWMGAKRIVVHVGSCTTISREQAMKLAMDSLSDIVVDAKENGMDDIHICPELLGKIKQLGDLDEIIELCKLSENLIPTIDFGHLHARGFGALNTLEDYLFVLNKIENELGYERLKNIHIHFSRIEFTKGGEKRHWNFKNIEYGPDYVDLIRSIIIKKMEPVIISESKDDMAQDALQMKKTYFELLENMSN